MHRPAHRIAKSALGALLAVGLLFPPAAHAQEQWGYNGMEVCVRPLCAGFSPLICQDGFGGALIVWERNPGLVNQDLYVQRVLANGVIAPGWPGRGVLAVGESHDQYSEAIVPDSAGGAFVAWVDYRSWTANGLDIYAQHVRGDGSLAPGWPTNGLPVGAAPGDQDWARMLADGAGGVFIVWEDARSGFNNTDAYAQHLNGDGTRVAGWPEGGLAVCTAPFASYGPHLCADGQGGCFIGWSDGRDVYGGEIYAQRVGWSGDLATGWPVNGRRIFSGGSVYTARGVWGVVPDGGGGAYIGWGSSHGATAYDDDVYAIRILADGSIAPGWPASGFPVATFPGQQLLNSVAADSTGGVLLGWYSGIEQPNTAYVQRLRPDGTVTPGWPAASVHAGDVVGFQGAVSVVPDGLGGTYVAYYSSGGSGSHDFIQHITATGALAPGWPTAAIPLVSPWTSSAYQQDAYFGVTADGSGGAIVAWNDTRNGISNEIFAQKYSGSGPTATLVSLTSVEALPDRVILAWHLSDGETPDAAIYRRTEEDAWSALGRAAFDGTGRLQFEDRTVEAGERYSYRLGWLESGTEQFSAETWVEVPAALALTLEGALPNPAVGALNVAFTLPRSGRASLELLDIAGRQLAEREVGDLGAGRHLVRLNESRRTPPGVYWLKLTQSERTLVKRAVVIQ
jgi:hypothetical protein